MAYLTLRYHGGQCCGMKHIHGFGSDLTRIEPVLDVETEIPLQGHTYVVNIAKDRWGAPLTKEPIPEENVVERLDRYLKWCEAHHKYGVTEVVLTTEQAAVWDATLTERGFKKVSECLNSNSSNRIHIYHLCRDKEEKPATKQLPLR